MFYKERNTLTDVFVQAQGFVQGLLNQLKQFKNTF